MGGSSKKVTIGYKYLLGVHFGLWKGPIDKITAINIDKRSAWAGENEGGPLTISADSLFGGDEREGGVSGTVDILMGEPTQPASDYLSSKLGGMVPAFRGFVSAVLRQCYMGNNPYLKPWAFVGQRIHVRQDGIEQWYSDKAAILAIPPDAQAYATYNFDINAITDGGSTASEIRSNGYNFSAGSSADLVRITTNHSGSYVAFSVWGVPERTTGLTGSQHTVSVVEGPDTSVITDFTAGIHNNGYAAARAVWEQNYPSGAFLTGSTQYYIGINDIPLADNSGGYSVTVDLFSGSVYDMNPAHIIRECLTDPDWGMGYSESDIDDHSFMDAADTFFSEGFGISISWTREGPLIDFVTEIIRHVDASLYVSRETGKFVLKPIRRDYSLSDLVILDVSNVVSVDKAPQASVGDLVSTVTVSYWNRETGEEDSVTRHNQSLQQVQQGGGSSASIAYPAVTSVQLASRVCQRDLNTLSTPLVRCTIEANRVAEEFNIGDAFILDWPDLNIDMLVMRVQQMTLGDSEKQTIVIEAIEDVFRMPSGTEAGSGGGGLWTDPLSEDPLPASPRTVAEAPYYALMRTLGQTVVDAALEDDADTGYLLAAAGRQGNEISAKLLVDSGAGYVEAEAIDFCPSAVVVGAVGYSDTVIYIEDAVDVGLVEAGIPAQIDDEIVRVDGVGEDSNGQYITVGRGTLDTVPASHADGTPVVFWGYDWSSDDVRYTASDSLDVKMLPVLGGSVLAQGDAPVDAVTFAGRAVLPYPPGKLQLDAVAYPPTTSGTITVTWAHRNREVQSDVLVDTSEDSVTPVDNTRYTLEFYDDSAMLIVSRDDIGPPTADVVLDYTGDVTLKLWTVDANGASLQQHEYTFAHTSAGGPSSITATDYTPVDDTIIIDGGGDP